MGPSDGGRERRRLDPRVVETRRLVKLAALDLIAEVGFEGTTIERISERSGVSRTTIYRHWPDPNVLLLEAFDPPVPEMEPPAPTGDFATDISAYIRHVADRLADERFVAALAAQVDKAQRDERYRLAHLQYAVARNEHGVRIFRYGIESGALRTEVDPEKETDLILGYLVYQRLIRHRLLDSLLLDDLASEIVARCRRPD